MEVSRIFNECLIKHQDIVGVGEGDSVKGQ